MFGDSLLEVSTAQKLRKGWITAFSMTLQATFVLCLLALPLLKPERITFSRVVPAVSFLSAPQEMQVAQQPSGSAETATTTPFLVEHRWSFHPDRVGPGPNEPAPPCIVCPDAGTPTGPTGLPFSITGSGPALPVPPQPHVDRPPRISHWMAGNLVYQVQPIYPQLARNAGIEGQVMLKAVISREGMVEQLQVVTGHPLLVRAALEAVRQWRYRPYVLNGEAIEVDTQVTVNFSLHRAE